MVVNIRLFPVIHVAFLGIVMFEGFCGLLGVSPSGSVPVFVLF